MRTKRKRARTGYSVIDVGSNVNNTLDRLWSLEGGCQRDITSESDMWNGFKHGFSVIAGRFSLSLIGGPSLSFPMCSVNSNS